MESKTKTSCRFTATVSDTMYERVIYWAGKKGISINELLRNAISFYIAHENNKDHNLPALEVQRLNRLVDSISVLSTNIGSLEKVIMSGFNSLIELTRGDNYLLDDDDGDIDVDSKMNNNK